MIGVCIAMFVASASPQVPPAPWDRPPSQLMFIQGQRLSPAARLLSHQDLVRGSEAALSQLYET